MVLGKDGAQLQSYYIPNCILEWQPSSEQTLIIMTMACPGRKFAFPKPYSHLFVWGDLDREQISVFDYISLYGVKSDGINRSVHQVHYILEQRRRT